MSHASISASTVGAELVIDQIELADGRGIPVSVNARTYRAALVDAGMLIDALMKAYPANGEVLQYGAKPGSRKIDALEVVLESPLAPNGQFSVDNKTGIRGAVSYHPLLSYVFSAFRMRAAELKEIDPDDDVTWAHAQIAAYASDEQLKSWFFTQSG